MNIIPIDLIVREFEQCGCPALVAARFGVDSELIVDIVRDKKQGNTGAHEAGSAEEIKQCSSQEV